MDFVDEHYSPWDAPVRKGWLPTRHKMPLGKMEHAPESSFYAAQEICVLTLGYVGPGGIIRVGLGCGHLEDPLS